MGFGLWENLDPAAPKKVKKRSPPPPPPKAEPIMYDCTVKVSKTISSKELDDLVTRYKYSPLIGQYSKHSHLIGQGHVHKHEEWRG